MASSARTWCSYGFWSGGNRPRAAKSAKSGPMPRSRAASASVRPEERYGGNRSMYGSRYTFPSVSSRARRSAARASSRRANGLS